MRARRNFCLTIDMAANDPRALTDILAVALTAAPVASVTLRAAAGSGLSVAAVRPLIDIAQNESVAALVADDCDLAKLVKADGVHVSWSKDPVSAYRSARNHLGDGYIVGADAGRSRHDAMSLGEAGADYVAFGIPPHVEDRATAEGRQIDLITWWSEIFEIPAVAFDVAHIEQAQLLADAGADFIAVTLAPNIGASTATGWVHPFAAVMTSSGKAA